MMKKTYLAMALCGALALGACSSTSRRVTFAPRGTPPLRAAEAPPLVERKAARKVTAPAPAINLQQMIIPPGRVGRRIQFPLRASYITIHSTSNRGATAFQHARGQLNGSFRGRSRWNRTGYLTWHFTVDDRVAIQSLPLNIQGEHADHDGPGNQMSIALEICEFRDPRRQAAAVDRAARLTAWLMRAKGIPLSNVVPHYHWPQHHFHDYQKPCPRIFMYRGRPGPRWEAFLRKVDSYS